MKITLMNGLLAGLLSATTLLLPAAGSQAQSPIQDTTPGCLVRSGAVLKFVPARGHSDDSATPACVLGDVGQMQARFYVSLARRFPNQYEPLQIAAGSTTPSAKSLTQVSPTSAPYHFVDYGNVLPPTFLFFEPAGLTFDGRQFGTGWELLPDGVTLVVHVTVLDNSKATFLREGYAKVVNRFGTAAGSMVLDMQAFIEQAAIFRGHAVELIPRQSGEVTSSAIAINDLGDVIVDSLDGSNVHHLVLYRDGKSRPLPVNHDLNNVFLVRINNTGSMILTDVTVSGQGRAYRIDIRTLKETVLPPQPTEAQSYAVRINDFGDVLGYSFGPGAERIGIWRANGEFKTYFLEGNAQFPTISNNLHFNLRGTILISEVGLPAAEVGAVYVVPQPGQRLNLADLVRDMPSDRGALGRITGFNDKGDISGVTWLSLFNELVPYTLQLGFGR
ncbi:hypothetical protein [Cupriavidus basilensis]|uniref:hypothetical protein n=1 Tax=Cupriavidus basilensis TaxID=68895 RepID=UPI0023E79EA3|nr:hypothetical protein [Cupriavidus basilensis]MDF3886295.1 hypothetical protein [Cupriavidus basilensis]